MKRTRTLGAIATALLFGACGGDDADRPSAEGMAGTPMGEMEGMEGMDMGGGMMAEMQAHMQRTRGASGDSLMAMMPTHRQMTANLLAQMNREMRDMNMADDAEWNETVSALREDLVRLPDMSAEEVQAFLPEHQARIDRLIEMHGSMMGDMQM